MPLYIALVLPIARMRAADPMPDIIGISGVVALLSGRALRQAQLLDAALRVGRVLRAALASAPFLFFTSNILLLCGGLYGELYGRPWIIRYFPHQWQSELLSPCRAFREFEFLH